ncbi:DUF4097 family beta strand repeat-containing protein [Streptomyces sp. NPDC058045]|uniref:DUF4097 family beta strand repeat-containing protein n=1 Tax=Streptomyces sp. NPDC058045 TaxID=3346311 RepID=UPI0036EFCA80
MTVRVVALGVRVCGLVAVAALVCGCGVEASEDKDPDQRSFALSGRTLTVDSDDSRLELVPSTSDRVRVTQWFKGRVVVGGSPEASWSVRGNTLRLRVKCRGFMADCATRHRVEVPSGVAVTVRDGDGPVSARGFRSALDVESGDGAIKVEDSSGPLTLRTSDGSVRASGIRSASVRVSTGDGSVRLSLVSVPDRVEARTGDGSARVALPRADGAGAEVGYRVRTSTGDGSVDVGVRRDDRSRHRVDVRTGDGRITVRNAN